MHRASAPRRVHPTLLLLSALLAILVVAGGTLARSEPDEPRSELEHLTVGLGFIPSVQFAQFYLADEAGFYEDAGLDVTFQNRIDPELITLLAQGNVDIGMADGTSLIPAVSQGIPVVYGATIYGRFPNIVFAPRENGITEIADLDGRRIGTPGRYGSSWTMLQAMLAAADLSIDDTEIVSYPDFGQGVALAQGQVDAATGFVNNEPVQARLQGTDVVVLRVDDVAPLPGPGLVVGTKTLSSKPEALRAFTAATLRAMDVIAEDPEQGLEATFARVPELATDPDTQRAILEATIDTWLSDHAQEHGLGAIDREAWQSAVEIMTAMPDSVVASPVTVDQLVTDELRP